MQTINTEEIMRQIRAEIKEKGLDSSMLSFAEIPCTQEVSHTDGNFHAASLQQSAEYLHMRSQIEPYKPIEGNFLVIFIKKVIRKLVKFYLMPIITEQNALNLHTANAVSQVSQYIQDESTSDHALLTRIAELEAKQEISRQEINALKSQISALQSKE